MVFKFLTATALAGSVALLPAQRATADAGDFVGGLIVGGLVGSAIQKNKQKTVQRQQTYRSGIPSTQEGRVIQSSLNYFGFNAGAVDGQLGQRSRNAISSYQAYLGYPITGQLSPFEYNLLTTSYNRAQAGGYTTNQAIANNPEGVRGLLKVYRAEMAGAPQQPQSAAIAATAPAPTTTVVAPTAAAPAAAMTETTSAIPNFFNQGTQASLASHCNTVSLVTNTNGGFTTAASMTDPTVVLNEQFCLARTYAIAGSEELIAQVQGFTPQQIAQQCEGFGPAMEDQIAALSLMPRDAVALEVSEFILGSGVAPAQLTATAKICLGVGYRTDNMDVALASGLLLYANGEKVYGELIGHHLAMGYGTTKRPDLAGEWYQAGIAAADSGADAAFAPGQPERTDLIRKASLQLSGSQ
jgi:peptidoglycan hydrolase-like protein with peptidoglycan-binding domain